MNNITYKPNNLVSFKNSAPVVKEEAPVDAHKVSDEILPNDPLTKLKIGVEQATSLPEYAVRGLKGDPNANFYEYLSLGKVPYYIGGPALAAVAMSAVTSYNPQATQGIVKNVKKLGMGVLMYYAGASLAKTVIDLPVKYFRGVDLNHPYRDVVDLRATNAQGISPKKKEYHNVFESVDFTRWDLLYNHKQAKADKINSAFDEIGKKYGIDENLNDSDSTLKSNIKQTIVMAKSWKYALSVPFVMLGLGLSKQQPWETVGKGLVKDIKQIINPSSALDLKSRLVRAKEVVNQNTLKPLIQSFTQLWHGQTKASSALGKAVVLGTALSTLYANYSILKKTSAEDEKMVDKSMYKS